jgi:hypothetical protein
MVLTNLRAVPGALSTLHTAVLPGRLAGRSARIHQPGRGRLPGSRRKGGCGGVTVIAGRCHKANRSRTFRKARPGEEREETFGNPFNVRGPAREGVREARHSCQEGFLGSQMTERFHALDKRWIRRKSQGLIDISISLCFLNASSIRGLGEQTRSGAPPGALAA